jgi:hypothetical protein
MMVIVIVMVLLPLLLLLMISARALRGVIRDVRLCFQRCQWLLFFMFLLLLLLVVLGDQAQPRCEPH